MPSSNKTDGPTKGEGEVIEGRCDCEAVSWRLNGDPGALTYCNCGICRRLGALWAYGTEESIQVTGRTEAYARGERSLAIHRCPTCGVTTHWASLANPGVEGHGRRAVNMRLADPKLVQGLRIKHFDGAGSWRVVPPGEQPEVPFFPG